MGGSQSKSTTVKSTTVITTNSGTVIDWDSSVVGQTEAKQALESSFFLPRKFPSFYGLSAGQGTSLAKRTYLFWGPPGTGKTLLAEALGKAHGAEFVKFSPSNTSKWVGETEKNIKAVFEKAKTTKTVILMDEIDSFGSKRKDDDVHWVRTQINQLLESIDDFQKHSTADSVLVGCTNFFHSMDEGILRRFQAHVFCGLPDPEDRKALLQMYLKNSRSKFADGEIETIVSKTELYSGSDLSTLVKSALLEPARELTIATHFKKDPGTNKWRPTTSTDNGAVQKKLKDLDTDSLERARDVNANDFLTVLKTTKPTTSRENYQKYIQHRNTDAREASAIVQVDPDANELQFIFDAGDIRSQFNRFATRLFSPNSKLMVELPFYSIPAVIFTVCLMFAHQYVLNMMWLVIVVLSGFAVVQGLFPLMEYFTNSEIRQDKIARQAFLQSSHSPWLLLIIFVLCMVYGQFMGRLPYFNVLHWSLDCFPLTQFLHLLFTNLALYLQFASLFRQHAKNQALRTTTAT